MHTWNLAISCCHLNPRSLPHLSEETVVIPGMVLFSRGTRTTLTDISLLLLSTYLRALPHCHFLHAVPHHSFSSGLCISLHFFFCCYPCCPASQVSIQSNLSETWEQLCVLLFKFIQSKPSSLRDEVLGNSVSHHLPALFSYISLLPRSIQPLSLACWIQAPILLP